jgi:protein-tyrosine-phosphatase
VSDDRDLLVLVVCSANQCRSPFGAAALGDAFARRGWNVAVMSSGTNAFAGAPATKPTIDEARRRGLDLTGHRSAPLDPVIAAEVADLVLGMERAHVREVVARDPRAWPHTFTLKELARRGQAVGPRRADEPVATWLARVGADRRPLDLLGASPDDDVADPTGSLTTDHTAMADDVTVLADRVAALVTGH